MSGGKMDREDDELEPEPDAELDDEDLDDDELDDDDEFDELDEDLIDLDDETLTGLSCLLVAVTIALTACAAGSIDNSQNTGLSNDDTYATLADIWSGAQAALNAKRDPQDANFTLPLSYTIVCPSGGQRLYQGTLTGTDSAGTGSATLAMTASLTSCAFDDGVKITTITATGIGINGTIAISNDAYATTNLHVTATTVTVNGIACLGGIDVTISGPSPSAQPTSTGTACGRAGIVPLP
jgi:hypothetical protein